MKKFIEIDLSVHLCDAVGILCPRKVKEIVAFIKMGTSFINYSSLKQIINSP